MNFKKIVPNKLNVLVDGFKLTIVHFLGIIAVEIPNLQTFVNFLQAFQLLQLSPQPFQPCISSPDK